MMHAIMMHGAHQRECPFVAELHMERAESAQYVSAAEFRPLSNLLRKASIIDNFELIFFVAF